MENTSKMGIQTTLTDVMQKLGECLRDLDEIGALIAAAHLSACIDCLAEIDLTDSPMSTSD
jgi:hypothetical protein